MSSEPRRSVWPTVVAALVFLPVLYVGSVGPVVWIVHQIGISPKGWAGQCIEAMYIPLLVVAEAVGAADFLRQYADLFSWPLKKGTGPEQVTVFLAEHA